MTADNCMGLLLLISIYTTTFKQVAVDNVENAEFLLKNIGLSYVFHLYKSTGFVRIELNNFLPSGRNDRLFK